jgi:hypothetical protein
MITPKRGALRPVLPKSFYTRNVNTFTIESYIEGDDDGDKLCYPTIFERHDSWIFCAFKKTKPIIINTALIGAYIIPHLKFLEIYNCLSHKEFITQFVTFNFFDKSIDIEFHFEWHIFIIDILIYNGKIELTLTINYSFAQIDGENYNVLYETINNFVNDKK